MCAVECIPIDIESFYWLSCGVVYEILNLYLYNQAFGSEHLAKSGQIVASKIAFDYISSAFEATVLPGIHEHISMGTEGQLEYQFLFLFFADSNFVRLDKIVQKVKMKGIQASRILYVELE